MNKQQRCGVYGAALLTLSHFCYPLAYQCPDSCDIVRDTAQDIGDLITAPSTDLPASSLTADYAQL